MEDFIFGNMEVILFIIAVVVFFVITERQIVKQMAVRFVWELETNLEYYVKAGLKDEEKREWVYEWYDWLPPLMKAVVSKKMFKIFVDTAFDRLYGAVGK